MTKFRLEASEMEFLFRRRYFLSIQLPQILCSFDAEGVIFSSLHFPFLTDKFFSEKREAIVFWN